MSNLNLMLHCGAHEVEPDALAMTETPPATDTWHPIPHSLLVDEVEGALSAGGLRIRQAHHALWRNGLRYFGLYEIASESSEFSTVVGLRNSHDKSFPAGLVLGSGVFVCDNLAFSGEIKLARKHTRFIMRDLSQLVHRAVGQLGDLKLIQETRIEAYKEAELSNAQADHLIVEMLRARIITKSNVDKVIAEWDSPRHPEHVDAGQTAWRLFNAATEALKGNLAELPRRTQALHGLMDSVSGVTLEGTCERIAA